MCLVRWMRLHLMFSHHYDENIQKVASLEDTMRFFTTTSFLPEETVGLEQLGSMNMCLVLRL